MEVRIDGVMYVPFTELVKDQSMIPVLDIRFDSDAGDDITIRDYLFTLLSTLWIEKEGFSGKRPFGNSGWEGDLAKPLVKYGLIKGFINEDGWAEDYNDNELDDYVSELIRVLFYGVKE